MIFEKQIISKDKYRSIFSREMEVIVLIIAQMFFAKRLVLKIGNVTGIFPSGEYSVQVGNIPSRNGLDQSRARENI